MVAKTVRLFVADDHPFVHEWFRGKAASDAGLDLVGVADSAEGIASLVDDAKADVLLVDVVMPGPDPFTAIEDVHRMCPNVRTIVWTGYLRDSYLDAAIKAGASGYLIKADDPAEVMDAIRRVAEGQFVMSPQVEERCNERQRVQPSDIEGKPMKALLDTLTPREQEVLRMIGRGMSRLDIAESMSRSPKTVDKHRASLMEKLDIHDRVELVRFAIREGLVEP